MWNRSLCRDTGMPMKAAVSFPVFLTLAFLGASHLACSGEGGGDGAGGAAPAGGSGGTGGSGTGGGSGGTASGGSATGGAASGGGNSGGTSSGGASGATLIGTPCVDDSDCPYEGGWCRTDYANGYCTKDCEGLGPCDQPGTVCHLSFGQCHKACTEATQNDDCRVVEGYSCLDRDGVLACE